MKIDDARWPTFDGKFVNYPKFKDECRVTGKPTIFGGQRPGGKTLRETCDSGEVRKMIGNVEDLAKNGTP
jgi:hypothetical protein